MCFSKRPDRPFGIKGTRRQLPVTVARNVKQTAMKIERCCESFRHGLGIYILPGRTFSGYTLRGRCLLGSSRTQVLTGWLCAWLLWSDRLRSRAVAPEGGKQRESGPRLCPLSQPERSETTAQDKNCFEIAFRAVT